MLDAVQDLRKGSRRASEPTDDRHSDERVQLVDRAIGIDACRVFGDALASDEAGLAFVAALGVDAIERE